MKLIEIPIFKRGVCYINPIHIVSIEVEDGQTMMYLSGKLPIQISLGLDELLKLLEG